MRSIILAAMLAMMPSFATSAAEPIKIGFISTFSGPQGGLGQELVDGFKLGLEHKKDALGGRPVKVVYGDDQAKPDIGRQIANKMIESNKVQIVTGINFSNVLLAVAKPVLDSGAFYISVNAGPNQFAGKQCHPHFFSASFQNDQTHEAIGIAMQDRQLNDVYIMAPNYPAGKDMLQGFKRFFKGAIVGEAYTAFGQLDYSAEIAQIRAKKPKAVMFFYPGGMGINFVKQYVQAGLKDDIPLYTGSHVIDQTVLPAIGEAAIGIETAALWSETLGNPQSKAFVEEFEKKYGRIPSPYAALAYDAVLLMDAALLTIGGQVEDARAFRAALENVKFASVRGAFRFNTNHFPIQDAHLTRIEIDDRGRLVAALRGVIAKDLKDAYAHECSMPPGK